MGAFFLMGSTANLDTGIQNEKWHTFCAGKFFIFTVIAQLMNTYLSCKLYFGHKLGNKIIVYSKIVLTVLYIIQAVISVNYGFFKVYGQQLKGDDFKDIVNIFLEWTLTYTVLSGFLLMSLDVKKFKMIYEEFNIV